MPDTKSKVSFADLDGFLKVAPMIGLLVLGYLQTLFPSKAEFEKVHDKLIQMDKKITEMAVLQNAISSNSGDIIKRGSKYRSRRRNKNQWARMSKLRRRSQKSL